MRCVRDYVTNPLCIPSRSSILTGQFPSRHGVFANSIPLREEIPALPEVLTRQGYRTALLGKVHFTPRGAPGFRESVADWERKPYGDWNGSGKIWEIVGRRPSSNPVMTWKSTVPVEAHHSTWIGDINHSLRGSPSLIPPFCPPEPYADICDAAEVSLPPRREGDLDDKPPHYRAWYEQGVRHEGYGGNFIPKDLSEQNLREMTAYNYGQVSLIADNVGRILAELERQGLAENTTVIFTADHGELLGEHGLMLKGPFMYEGLLRVPFLVRRPDGWPTGASRTPSSALLA